MTSAQDFLDYAYQANDAAKAEVTKLIQEEDERRLALLAGFADAKLIVTSLRALQEASAGRLVASVSKNEFQETATIVIRDAKVADRAMTMRMTYHDERHGFRMFVDKKGVTLKPQKDDDCFFRQANDDEMAFSENGLMRMNEISGAVPAFQHIFGWAGHSKDEDGKWYIERPKVYPMMPRAGKSQPKQ